jgi:hypothetical protein
MSVDFSSISSKLSLVGSWTPTGATDPATGHAVQLVNNAYSVVHLANGRDGLIFGGWAYTEFGNSAPFFQTQVTLFQQEQDGKMSLATSAYISNATTNGVGSMVVSDFNQDGYEDVFLLAHNESPFIPKASTVLLSKSDGTFSSMILNDAIAAHGASLGTLNGVQTVFSNGWDGQPNPYYQYVNGQFRQTQLGNGQLKSDGYEFASVFGDTSATADFNGDGKLDMVLGDSAYGPGYAYDGVARTVVYTFSDIQNKTNAPLFSSVGYFNNKPQYANIPSLNNTKGQTHNYRVWVDDFNYDGKPDIISGQSLWPSNYSVLQMLQNTSSGGVTSFLDKTDILNSAYDLTTQEVDYSMQRVDIDGSGINSYLSAGSTFELAQDTQANYILLNDGTGSLHVYMHDQFRTLANYVNSWLLSSSGTQKSDQGKFVPFLTADKHINFLYQIDYDFLIGGKPVEKFLFVNVPVRLNPTVDYTDNITIADRNSSSRMRTWAGNDTIKDTNANTSPAHIDGGLGIDIASYSRAVNAYQIARKSDGSTKVTGNGIADTLANIERIQFTDKKLALDLSPTEHGGLALEFIGLMAPAAVNTPSVVGLILGLFDQGMSLHDVCQMAIDVGLVNSTAGSDTNSALAAMAFRNLIGSEADAPTVDMLVGFMDGRNASYTQAEFMAVVAGLEVNQTHIGLIGFQQTGVEFV